MNILSKLKNIWQKNKVIIVLVIILIMCFIAICTVTISYFFGGSDTVLGERLDGIEDHPITEDFKTEYQNSLSANESVSSVKFKVSNRIIYIYVDFVIDTSLEDAKSIITTSMASFTENILSFYDINFILSSDASENSDGFTIMGAKNMNTEGIVWNNNTQLPDEEESEE